MAQSSKTKNPAGARAAPPTTLFGCIDELDGTTIRGWAVDAERHGRPTPLLLVIDGQPCGAFNCTDPRPDLQELGLPTQVAGFRVDLPEAACDGRLHKLSIRFRSGESLPFLTANGQQHGEMDFRVGISKVFGVVDGMFGASIHGWAFREDLRTGKRTGGLSIEVRANGVRLDQIKANLIRNDVGQAHGAEPHCGFLYPLPTRYRDGSSFIIEFHVAPEGVQLDGSPFSGNTLIRDSVDQLFGMHAKVEALCTEMYALKDQLRQMVTVDEHTLDIYPRWAASYFECLTARVVAERRTARYRELLAGEGPKVSVICPTYKPDLAEFAAAVASVRNQSWTNWELLIVDDGSGSPALTEVIEGFCRDDKRIRAIKQAKNGGISVATNAAIAAAAGDYVALFDHDDVLVEVALEVMVLTARHTGAPVLYSDEDKIDSHGALSEPHLKSDWNYRLALTNNFVCHLLMVERATLAAVGPLQSKYDGAQDHDLVLRLFESVGPHGIHHVPEILYHWRKSANSTASQQSSKSYAVEAGRSAIADHAARRGLQATVTAPFNSTLFDVRWQFEEEPKVTILIPFKDQLETTRKCVECILAATTYKNYEIVLIDNWSIRPETLDWLESMSGRPDIRVVRIEERFNYSRINNVVAQQVETDFFLFMNNDVFVYQSDWMRIMVDEALADDRVGIVGVRLLYPNTTVQHAGVILGVGGVADHAFRYYPRDELGYAFRAVCAQDLSAVTAACMLCRADAFREVGMFDAERLSVAFNDVDLCLKVGRAGYRVLYTPAVIAEHWESLSRGSDLDAHNLSRFYEENQVMMDRWNCLIRRDPFYNQHFSRETGVFEKLSSASVTLARAPALLRDEPRAVVEPLPAPKRVIALTEHDGRLLSVGRKARRGPRKEKAFTDAGG